MHVAAMGLRKLVTPDAFLTSPLVRARETAEDPAGTSTE